MKIIVHSGAVLFHRVLQFNELAGTDVIIVHRLLKNSVQAEQYLLLTETARRELEFPEKINFKSSSETYEDLGLIRTEFHDFDSLPAASTASTAGNNFGSRYRESFRLFLKLWFAPFVVGKRFNHLPAESSYQRKVGFAMLTVLMTPIFVPVSAVLLIFNAFKAIKATR